MKNTLLIVVIFLGTHQLSLAMHKDALLAGSVSSEKNGKMAHLSDEDEKQAEEVLFAEYDRELREPMITKQQWRTIYVTATLCFSGIVCVASAYAASLYTSNELSE